MRILTKTMKMTMALPLMMAMTSPRNADAFVNPISRFFEKQLLNRIEFKIFDDVALPPGMTPVERIKNLLELAGKANVDLVKFTIQDTAMINECIGSNPKMGDDGLDTYEMRKIQTIMVNNIIKVTKTDPDPMPGYLYFGDKKFSKILSTFCKVNPFFTTALSGGSNNDYIELNAYSEDEPKATDTLYVKVMREMSDPSHRINVRFNADSELTIDQIAIFDEAGKKTIVPKDQYDYYASGVLYNMLFYASCQHATIHILHYLMTAGIAMSTKHNRALASWADPYNDSIAVKHAEVAILLFHSTRNGQPVGDGDTKVVSGKDGFGASKEIMPHLREMLCVWGACKSADDFLNTFVFRDLRKTAKNADKLIQKCGLLEEYTKHMANVEPFAEDLTATMKKDVGEDFDLAQAKLKAFMADTGGGVSDISTISEWIQLMSSTGIMHGSTLSYSRLCVIPDVMRWRNIASSNWEPQDEALIGGTIGTIQGMTIDRHVFSDKMDVGVFKWNTEPMTAGMKAVLKQYNEKALALKVKSKEELKKRSDFCQMGWILTDHCEDGYDGKQHTLTTYI